MPDQETLSETFARNQRGLEARRPVGSVASRSFGQTRNASRSRTAFSQSQAARKASRSRSGSSSRRKGR